jgi:hypothetical protein
MLDTSSIAGVSEHGIDTGAGAGGGRRQGEVGLGRYCINGPGQWPGKPSPLFPFFCFIFYLKTETARKIFGLPNDFRKMWD